MEGRDEVPRHRRRRVHRRSVVRNLLKRGVPVVVGELKPDEAVLAKFKGAEFEPVDVADAAVGRGRFVAIPISPTASISPI